MKEFGNGQTPQEQGRATVSGNLFVSQGPLPQETPLRQTVGRTDPYTDLQDNSTIGGVNSPHNYYAPSPTVFKSVFNPLSQSKGKANRTGNFACDLFFEVLDHSATHESYAQIRERLKIIGEKHYDAEFPPEWSSLVGFAEDTKAMDMKLWKKISWKRAPEIFEGKSYKFFTSDGIKPNNIAQGYLGDCYFLSALAAIAEKPDRIKRLFVRKIPSSTATLCVQLCIGGIWGEIPMDNFFPFYEPEKSPAFTRNQTRELWVMTLEKAWAKVHRGYLNINQGLASDALHDLTGAPTISFRVGDKRLWDQIGHGERNGYIMTAGANESAGRDILSSIGLVGSHSYSLLGAHEVFVEGFDKARLAVKEDSRQDKRFKKLVKLRNPWGRGEWKGDWSQKSHLWSTNLKKQLKVTDSEDGIFFMDFEDFRKYFTDVQICYYHDKYKYSAKRFSEQQDQVFLELKVEKEGVYYISTHQAPAGQFPASHDYKYANVSLVLAKRLEDGKYEYVEGAQASQRDSFVCFQCSSPGSYLAYVRAEWKSSFNKYAVSCYGPSQVEILEQPEPQGQYFNQLTASQKYQPILSQIFLDRAVRFPKPFTSFDEHGEPDIRYFHDQLDDGFGYFYFENGSEDTKLQASVMFKKMKNLVLLEPHEGLQADVTVAAGHNDIVLYRIVDRPATLSFVVSPSFKKSVQGLKTLAQARGRVESRLSPNKEEVGIEVYQLRTQDGLIYYYKNNSHSFRLVETAEFRLENCQVETNGRIFQNSYRLELELNAGEDYLFHAMRQDGAPYFKVGVSNNEYRVVTT